MRCLGYDVWEWAELVSGLLGISKARVLVGDVNVKELWKVFEEVLKYPRGYPVQYILRKAVFYGFEFYVEEGVFIPRSDTEKIVDIVLKLAPRNGKVLDLCTGSGVIGITLKLLRTDLKVFLSDKDKKA
jgi:Methylase of polypeptide chain release factors